MSRSVRLVLLSLTLFLILFPLAAVRPGQPPTFKADEPAYFLMALSLVEDGDLLCDIEDVQRAFDHYPYRPVDNLILMSPDGWETIYFGKPYIYSLFAAPAAALFGANGLVMFNMVLLMAMVWMGASYLRGFNADAPAALLSTAFFLLSPAFAYAFWMHPEIFNMFSVAACLYLAFHQPADVLGGETRWGRVRQALFGPRLRPVWSGAALALCVYNKPMLGILGLPALWLVTKRHGVRAMFSWLAGAGIAMALIAGTSVALTGEPTAYLGVDRGGLKILSPEAYLESVEQVRQATEAHRDEAANSWQWMFRLPQLDFGDLAEDGYYFLLGRHTGLVPYMPFAVLALVLFLAHGRRSLERWLTLAALVAVALVFLLWIPFNWHGGGGFIGNRYFVNAYPAFLFLITVIRPTWLPMAGSAIAAVLLGSILFTPWGAAVPNPSMQAHVRGGLFRFFPFEVSMRRQIPGYESFGYRGLGFLGERSVFKIVNEPTGVMWTRGATRAEIWLSSREPVERLIFEVLTRSPDNEITLELGDERKVLTFEGATQKPENQRRVEFEPSRPTRAGESRGRPEFLYKMVVSSRTGRHEGGNMMNVAVKPLFYIGAQLKFIGTDDRRAPKEEYRIAWEECPIPAQMEAGRRNRLRVKVRNDGVSAWGMTGPTQVNLVYRWLDAEGNLLPEPRERSRLHRDVRPGDSIARVLWVRAPESPGRYVLVLDAVRRNVAVFSRRGGSTCQDELEVVPSVEAAESSGAPS